ncbi:unnamed protein product, partial [Musa hybrid cultivar]
LDCIKSRPLPTAQCTPGHPCPKPSDSFSPTTTAFPRRPTVFLPIGEQRKQRRCLLRSVPVVAAFSSVNGSCRVFLSFDETADCPHL